MLRNQVEYEAALARLAKARRRISEERDLLEHAGFSEEHANQVVRQMQSSCRELQDDVATYERRTAPTWRVHDLSTIGSEAAPTDAN